jgi:hypothetical protein
LDLELSVQKANLFQQNLEHENDKKHVSSSTYAPKLILDKKSNQDVQDIALEISRLQDFVSYLEADVYKKQESFKEELQNLSSQFNHAICIPPMSRYDSEAA